MKKFIKLLISFFLLISITGCKKSELDENVSEKEINVEIPDEELDSYYDELSTEELASFYKQGGINDFGYYGVSEDYDAADAIYNKFALKLLNKVYTKNENEIISPLSLFMALALLDNGARSDSRLKIENLLGMCQDDLNNYMYDSLTEHNSWGSGYDLVNAIWFDNSQNKVTLKQSFIDKINEYYGSVVNVDNFKDKVSLVNNINNWASKNTNGEINNVISEEDIEDDTLFYLLNALASGDCWLSKFNSNITFIENFNNYDGTDSQIEMMNSILDGYWEGENCEGIVKATENGNFRFVAIMPDEGIDIYDFLTDLDPTTITSLVMDKYTNLRESTDEHPQGLADYYITTIGFPKYEYKKKYDLSETLKKMGLSDLFDYKTSDFTDMCDGESGLIYLKNIWQYDSILVNEEKVEASALTVIEGGLGGAGPEIDKIIYRNINFNRPFIYALVSGPTLGGKILFVGIYSNSDYESNQELIPIEIIVDGKIKVRSEASTDSDPFILETWPDEVRMCVYTGDKLFAYEKKEAEGYTWYRLGENAWIADKNGEWIKELTN